MTRASESSLGLLHERVADVMLRSLDQAGTAEQLLVQFPNLPEQVLEFLVQCSEVSPQLLNAATKFLKDNDISCNPEEADDLRELESALAKRRETVRMKTFDVGEYDA